MSAPLLICLLTMAMGIGYRWGRRSSASAAPWHQRTRRSALGRQAMTLAALLAASQFQRSVERRHPGLTRHAASAHDALRQLRLPLVGQLDHFARHIVARATQALAATVTSPPPENHRERTGASQKGDRLQLRMAMRGATRDSKQQRPSRHRVSSRP